MDFHNMKRKELQALCKKHKIPANLTNFEMANRLTSLFKGKDGFFTERRSCLKLLDENGREIESNIENKRVKKVRFSPEIKMFQFEKSEPRVFEVKKRGRRTSVTTEVSIVENEGGPELSEEVVTSSRGRRLVEKIVADNEESRVMTRRSSRLREILDGGKRKEDMEKGRKEKGRERNLRQGKQKARNSVAKRGESNVECVAILAEKKLRRSKRNVMKVEDYKLSRGTVATGSSLEPLNTMVSEGTGPSGLDIDAGMGGKEKSGVGLAMRRSRRTASRNEPLITLDDLVAEVNYERKLKRQKKDPVQEQEVVLVDSISIEMPLAPLSPNVKRSEKVAPAIVAGKSARKAMRESKKRTVEIEDYLPENLRTEELRDVDVQPTLAGATEDSIARDSDNGDKYASESAELDNTEPVTGTSRSQTKEVDQSVPTDPKGIQIWVELPIDMETMSRSASLDHLVADEGISGEHQGLETVSVDVLERYRNASLNGPCEREGCTSSVKDKTCEVNLADSADVNANYNGDCSYTLGSGRALEHKDLSLNMQTNDDEVDNVAGDRNFDREELKCAVSSKSDERNPLEENYDASDNFYESSFPEPSRSATRMLERGNVKGREDSEEPTDLKGKHLASLSRNANVMENNCSQIECGTCISSVESTTKGNTADAKAEKEEGTGLIDLCKRTDDFPARKDHHDENPVNSEDVIAAKKCRTSISPNGSAEHHYDESIDPMNLNTTDQSPTMHWNGCEASFAAEIDRDYDQLKLKSDEFSKFAEDRPLEGQYHSPKKRSRCSTSDAFIRSAKSILQEEIDKCEDSVGLQENASGPKKQSYEAEPDKDENVGFIQSYVREDCTSTKRDKNHEENPMNSDIALVAMKCGTSNSPCVPVLHNNEDTTITMKLDIALEQREHSLDVDSGCEAESVAEVDRNNGQVELKSDALSKPQYHSPNKRWESSISGTSISARSMLQDEIDNYEDSVGVLKNAASPEKSYEAEPDKDENIDFNQSCAREECTSDKRDDDHLENPTSSPTSSDNAKCGTYDLPCVSVLKYNEEATNTMKLDISLEQREHSPVVNRNGCEADSVAEVEGNHDQVDLKPKDLSRSIEERPFAENYCSPRSIQQGSKDSIECQANTTSSRKALEDTPDKVGNMGFTDSHIIKKCISVQINDNAKEVSVYSEDLMGAIGNFSHIPFVDNNEYTPGTGGMALDQSKQTPILQMNGCNANHVGEDDRSLDQLELYSDESAQSNVSYSRNGSRMLQDEVVSGNKDSMKRQQINYEVAPEEDGNAGYIKSYVIDRYTSIKNYEDNPDKSEDAMGKISETVNFVHIPMVDKSEHICTRNLEMMALENKEQSLTMQQNGCETDTVADDYQNQVHRELKHDESVKDRPFKEQCGFPDKCWMPSASYLSRRIDAGEDFKKSADLLGTSTVTPSLAAEAVERNSSATEYSSSISNFGSTDPLDPTPTLDGPEFKEVSDDVNKSRQPTCPDTSVQKQENMNAINDVADAFKTCKEANDFVDLASFKRGNNNAEDVDITKFQEVALAVESSISYAIEAADTSAEGAHSPLSGDETLAINRGKEDSNGSSEKISNFASTELSEAKFDMNNFKEEFSCKDQEDSGKENGENLSASFPEVEFTMSEIQCEEKIVDIREDVSLKLYKHHEILKESDVADTINEYIESESTMNPSLRIDDTSDALHIGMSTKVPELEDKHAEQTVDTSELSVEKDDHVKGSEAAADLEETVLGSAWISDSKTANNQCKNSDLMAKKSICLGTPKNMRDILIYGTPKKLQMLADMKENLPSFKREKVGCLTTVKPTTKRTALKDVLQKKK